MKIVEKIEAFASHPRANSNSIHTVGSYLYALSLLEKWLRRTRGLVLIARITPHHLDGFLTSEETLFTAAGHPRRQGGLGRMRPLLHRIVARFVVGS